MRLMVVPLETQLDMAPVVPLELQVVMGEALQAEAQAEMAQVAVRGTDRHPLPPVEISRKGNIPQALPPPPNRLSINLLTNIKKRPGHPHLRAMITWDMEMTKFCPRILAHSPLPWITIRASIPT